LFDNFVDAKIKTSFYSTKEKMLKKQKRLKNTVFIFTFNK